MGSVVHIDGPNGAIWLHVMAFKAWTSSPSIKLLLFFIISISNNLIYTVDLIILPLFKFNDSSFYFYFCKRVY